MPVATPPCYVLLGIDRSISLPSRICRDSMHVDDQMMRGCCPPSASPLPSPFIGIHGGWMQPAVQHALHLSVPTALRTRACALHIGSSCRRCSDGSAPGREKTAREKTKKKDAEPSGKSGMILRLLFSLVGGEVRRVRWRWRGQGSKAYLEALEQLEPLLLVHLSRGGGAGRRLTLERGQQRAARNGE